MPMVVVNSDVGRGVASTKKDIDCPEVIREKHCLVAARSKVVKKSTCS